MQKKDYFSELKTEMIRYCIDFMLLRTSVVVMLETNRWVVEDINLYESFCHLQEMIENTYQEFTKLVVEINTLEFNGQMFNVCDIIDQFTYIKESIQLESKYMTNMIDYMEIICNSAIEGNEITARCNQYVQNDETYLSQMKLNNEGLKKLKKERRDLVE